jgi:hypothetical protein
MPLPAVGCADAAFVQRRRNGDHAYRASRLNAPDNGQEIGDRPLPPERAVQARYAQGWVAKRGT